MTPQPDLTETKTIRVSASGYDAIMLAREILKQGLDALPAEYRALADEELAACDEAFSRQAVHAIAARVLLKLLREATQR